MDEYEFSLENLPSEAQEKLQELALAMGVSEEEIVAKVVHLTLNLCDHPNDPGLRIFVQDAQAALKQGKLAG